MADIGPRDDGPSKIEDNDHSTWIFALDENENMTGSKDPCWLVEVTTSSNPCAPAPTNDGLVVDGHWPLAFEWILYIHVFNFAASVKRAKVYEIQWHVFNRTESPQDEFELGRRDEPWEQLSWMPPTVVNYSTCRSLFTRNSTSDSAVHSFWGKVLQATRAFFPFVLTTLTISCTFACQ